ncbi:carboxymuconolactone decarboxylase family protein [Sphingomonas immobilis]|uniref:Carboxymuconolactone decarboxylase family protein n=1 Tax=Sphingomonas immobilis TaxID=3063997 RepID=A0ABT8ZXA2_9SPHN|nr:carboxymuconolactone decarboxylase family protein [Sphingomonas sp. CA1-15]MDO7842205.1 carboxymuconolactone decarboxylase family protein [Sphingomonas sp. CA1-15]
MTDAPERQMTPAEREQYGRDWFEYTMTSPAPPPDSAYRQAGIANFVFAEMWSRPGLDMRTRRFITLACVGAADTAVPIMAHVYAAMKSGDVTYEEMMEFVLHFAVYSGWPKASILEQTVREQWERIQKEGGTVQMTLPVKPGA